MNGYPFSYARRDARTDTLGGHPSASFFLGFGLSSTVVYRDYLVFSEKSLSIHLVKDGVQGREDIGTPDNSSNLPWDTIQFK